MTLVRIVSEGWATGLTGTIGVRLNAIDGTVIATRVTAGISETPASSGRYAITVDVDDGNWPFEHIWDNGTGGFASGVVEAPVTGSSVPVLIRSSLGLATANIDTQLAALSTLINDVPTVSEFNARTLPAASYFDPAVDTVLVGDKTGFSLSQAFPANFSSLGINSSGHVSRVTLVDTTTTNTDMVEIGDIASDVADEVASTVVAPIVAGVLAGEAFTLSSQIIAIISGSIPQIGDANGFLLPFTTKRSTGEVIPGVEVVVTTTNSSSTNNVVANGITNSAGKVEFRLAPGTYYLWRNAARISFIDPVTAVVANNGAITFP